MKLSINNQLNLQEDKQKEIEDSVTPLLAGKLQKNVNQLKTAIPNLANQLDMHTISNHGLVINKKKELNLLIKSDAILLYPFNARDYTSLQLKDFFNTRAKTKKMPSCGSECLVIIGIGLGYHLLELAEKTQAKYIILYEPQTDFLKLSLHTAPWFELLTHCNANDVKLFIQHGIGVRNLEKDIIEIRAAFPDIGSFFYYRHFSYETLDLSLQKLDVTPFTSSHSYDLHPYILPNVSKNNSKKNTVDFSIFEKNVLFFEKNKPCIARSIKNYIQKVGIQSILKYNLYEQWEFGAIYLEEERNTLLKDPLIYGLSLSKKNEQLDFTNFLFNIKSKIETTLSSNTVFSCFISEIVLLGVLDTEACLESSEKSEKLIVIETNLRRFIASSFATPWFEIAQRKQVNFLIDNHASLENTEALFLNNKCDFLDVFIYQPYYCKAHKELSLKILESIQSTNGKSNHFETMFNKLVRSHKNTKLYPIANIAPQKSLSEPVIIIGNGPSLESNILELKKSQDKAILISCGTSLATLFKNDIIPDYHIELEKENDTLIRLHQLSKAKLKTITLIATPELHLDIPKLFKKTLLANPSVNFITDALYKEQQQEPPKLNYSYYTVTNFALDLMLWLNFKLIYLVGVDFGFNTLNEHHASSSDYFNDQGKSIYDYELHHGATIEVPSNLNGVCLTIPVFNSARLLMEKCIAKNKLNANIYNVGDGAKIEGTDTLISLKNLQLRNTLEKSKERIENCFSLFVSIASDNLLKETLTLSDIYCKKLLSIWTNKELIQHDPSYVLTLLAQQEQLLTELQFQSQAGFEMLNGSCRYFSMLCYRYVKTNEASLLIKYFTEQWSELLKQYSKKLTTVLHN